MGFFLALLARPPFCARLLLPCALFHLRWLWVATCARVLVFVPVVLVADPPYFLSSARLSPYLFSLLLMARSSWPSVDDRCSTLFFALAPRRWASACAAFRVLPARIPRLVRLSMASPARPASQSFRIHFPSFSNIYLFQQKKRKNVIQTVVVTCGEPAVVTSSGDR